MEYKFEKLTDKIFVCASSDHRFGTDAFLLADFSGYRSKDKVCDLGTGCGIIPLIMQKKLPPQVTYAVDIQEEAINQLRLGMEKSDTSGIIPICADLKELWDEAPLGKLDLVTCNPPYMKCGSGNQNDIDTKSISRHEVMCTVDDVINVSAKLLIPKGRFFMIHRPNRLVDIMCAMRKYKIEPKRMRFVHPSYDKVPNMVLIEGMRDGGEELKLLPPLYVYNQDGTYSDEIHKIYGN